MVGSKKGRMEQEQDKPVLVGRTQYLHASVRLGAGCMY